MTSFMIQVADLLAEGTAGPDDAPRVRPAERRRTADAADEHVITRSLAEQLVSEANAVLAEEADRIALTDELAPDRLGFSLDYRGRQARIVTVIDGHRALTRLIGVGAPGPAPVELAGPDELPALILTLVGAGR